MFIRLLFSLLGCILTAEAAAQTRGSCGARALIVEHLESRYGEVRTGAGLSGANAIVEIFSSPDSGSWTIIMSLPDGRACLIAAGEAWDDSPRPPSPAGAPA